MMKKARRVFLSFAPPLCLSLLAAVATAPAAAPAPLPLAAQNGSSAQAQAQAVDPFYTRLLDAGRDAYQRGSFQETVDNLKIAFFGYLDHPAQLLECYIYLEVSYFELRDLDGAVRYREEIRRAKLEAELPKLALPKALVDRYLEINASLDRFEAKTPSLSQLARPAALATAATPSMDDEIARLTSVLAADPKNGNAWVEIGKIYETEKKPKDALAAMERAVRIVPDNIELLYSLATLYYGQGAFEKAKTMFIRVRELGPEYKDLIKYLALIDDRDITLARETQKSVELARAAATLTQKAAYYKLALKKDPANADVALEFAGVYAGAKQYGDAAKVLEPLVKARTADERVYRTFGQAYLDDRSFGKAVDALKKGFDAIWAPGTAGPIEIRYLLAEAYMGAGKFQDALDELDVVQSQDPNFRDSVILRQQCQARIKK
jgi:cytochrome c-type biogenesis protein CcmH/NrfG